MEIEVKFVTAFKDQLTLILLFFILESSGENRLSLDSDQLDGSWTVWNQNKSIQTVARVPGGIYTDLQSAGILGRNLFYRFNDIEYRWVAKDNWFYQRKFDLPLSMLNKSAVNLVFHGIDTIGEIYLNGKLMANVDNMFVRYVLPIKDTVKEKNNELRIQIKSSIHEASRLSQDQNRTYPVPPQCTPNQYNGECHVNFLRKMQASFSWDWGPAFPSVGIWKSVEIEAFDLGVIRDITATPFKVNQTTWKINATAFIEYAHEDVKASALSGFLTIGDIARNDGMVKAVMGDTRKDTSPYVGYGFESDFYFYIDQNAIEPWWPNGFGKQPLYNLTISLKSIDHSECSTKSINIGFRTVELVQEELEPGKPGLSFYFKINGIPIFAKGSNWIPGHILPELGYDESMLRHALQSAKNANMNMLRVWGGGVYESDTFYRIADELGILIWQDMMFACSMYPVDEKFLESIKMETEQQIRRLQYHPSIALWAGNNENEVALRQNWYGTGKNFTLYKNDYIKLYVDTIKQVVEKNDKSRYYAVSSPSNGMDTERENYVASNPQSPLFGDVHHYEYILDGWNSYIYPDTRFASEYGFQSMPSFQSMAEVSLPEDRNLGSKFTTKRQHHIIGNFAMLSLIQRNLPHFDIHDSEECYKTFIYYSQVMDNWDFVVLPGHMPRLYVRNDQHDVEKISQAMAIKAETEKYRRDRSKQTSDNKGNTMGAMYWQLNDVWQAPSWSSIEFGGKWKMLHYYAKKFFAPVLVSPERTPSSAINVFLISDLLEDIPNVQLKVSIYAWDDFIPRKTYSDRVILKKATSTRHKVYQLSDLLEGANCKPEECFIYFTLEGPNIASENVIYPAKFHAVNDLKKPNFSVTVTRTENPSEAAVKVTTDRIAAFVWLDTEANGEFSDNGFLLLKREVNLIFKSKNDKYVDVEKIRSTITIRSLESSYASSIKRHFILAKTVTQSLTTLAVEGIKRVFS